MRSVIIGSGDVGRRIVAQLIDCGVTPASIRAFVYSQVSKEHNEQLGIAASRFDLDNALETHSQDNDLSQCHAAQVYYTVAPQPHGVKDLRTRALVKYFFQKHIEPCKVVVISTTGVYGDCRGEWVDETSPTQPQTERGKRRLDSEQQWCQWGKKTSVPVVILRVPGIYARSRLPRERIRKRTPVVNPQECGFTNRIHANDLASISVIAMQKAKAGDVFNVTDGTPGKISEYLQAAALELGEPALPEISMHEAHTQLSSGMLSYLSESRKISNRKMLRELGVVLRYPDFREGIKF